MRLYVYLLLFVPFISFSQPENSIPWSGPSDLSWNDFNGKVDSNSKYQAITTWGISYSFSKNIDGQNKVKIISYFDKNESWVNSNHMTSSLLTHEQQHFNLAEIYTRLLLKKIKKLDSNKIHPDKISILYSHIINNCIIEQERYDKDTEHGLIKESQLKWQKNIIKRLKKLQKFAP